MRYICFDYRICVSAQIDNISIEKNCPRIRIDILSAKWFHRPRFLTLIELTSVQCFCTWQSSHLGPRKWEQIRSESRKSLKRPLVLYWCDTATNDGGVRQLRAWFMWSQGWFLSAGTDNADFKVAQMVVDPLIYGNDAMIIWVPCHWENSKPSISGFGAQLEPVNPSWSLKTPKIWC